MTTTPARKRSWSWTQVEAEYALPMREILVTLYVEHGTKAAVARVLNVQASAVNDWWMRSGLPELRPTITKSEAN